MCILNLEVQCILSGAKLLFILQLNVAVMLISFLCMDQPSIICAGFERHQKIITGERFSVDPLLSFHSPEEAVTHRGFPPLLALIP